MTALSSLSMKPAILGGDRAVNLASAKANRWPIITGEEERAVIAVLRDGDLSCHPVTRQLEADYRRAFGTRHALAHCNGTAALLAAFFALDLQPGDEILVPSATFWASVVPMLWVGALPVFCESESERLGLDPEDVQRKITPRTRAIVVVHLFGMPSKMGELLDIARRNQLKVIEDASHAHGALWKGRKCGTLGDLAVFSLQSSKLAPAGEGGMLLTDDDELMERAMSLGDMTRALELKGPARRFAATTFGIKTRMAPLSAAVARVQFRRLEERNCRRNTNLTYLSGRLEELGLHTFLPPRHVKRVYFEYMVRWRARDWGMTRDVLLQALREEGCDVCAPRYPLLHQQPLFVEGHFADIARLKNREGETLPVYRSDALPHTAAANAELIKLPTFPLAQQPLLDQYVRAFEKVLTHSRQIAAAARQPIPALPGAGPEDGRSLRPRTGRDAQAICSFGQRFGSPPPSPSRPAPPLSGEGRHSRLQRRKTQWEIAAQAPFDVAIIGGGISGACLFHQLSTQGFRVLLVDKGDFAGGTSQASAMMVWGGLLYLSNLDLFTVARLCESRDRLIKELGDWVRPQTFRYLSRRDGGRKRLLIQSVLYFYWLLSRFRRSVPRLERNFPEMSFLNSGQFGASLEYEEACVSPSDARFVLHWILSRLDVDRVAMNYCALHDAHYDSRAQHWHLDLVDSLLGREEVTKAKWIINTAGIWTDSVNQQLGVRSPFKHVFGKGVFIGLKRHPRHQTPLIIDTGDNHDSFSLIPWGPISLWGPTETLVTDAREGFSVSGNDIQFLLQQCNRHLSTPIAENDIVSFRCGVRPLATRRDASVPRDLLELSRRHFVHYDHQRSCASVYGGKLTSSVPLAQSIVSVLSSCLPPNGMPLRGAHRRSGEMEWEDFPGISEKVVSARRCAETEMCWTLEDYLRRRTNISQWTPRCGLGLKDENVGYLRTLAGHFYGNDSDQVEMAVRAYREKVKREFDSVLEDSDEQRAA